MPIEIGLRLSYAQDDARVREGALDTLELFMKGFVRTVATTAQNDTAPVRSGHLKSTIHEDSVTRTATGLESGVSVDADYALFVHEPTRPHEIRPVRARALRWFGDDGRPIFAQRVWHPGTRGNPFLTNAAHRVMSADPRIAFGE